MKDFEAMYGDVTRLRSKKSSEARMAPGRPAARGTPSVTERRHSGKVEAPREVNIAEVVYPEGSELRAAEVNVPRYTKLKGALDSGAGALLESSVPASL